MTRGEILALKRGDEIEAAVARDVLGFTLVPSDLPASVGCRRCARWRSPDGRVSYRTRPVLPPEEKGLTDLELPHYSTSIAAAWEVFLTMPAEDKIAFTLTLGRGIDNRWRVFYYGGYDGEREVASEDSPEMAVCRAALLLGRRPSVR